MSNIPLAERLRPHTLDDYVGQEHLVGKNGVFRKFFETGNVPSFILWGPPGVGKTTLARIIANRTKAKFIDFSAVTSGIKEIRQVMEQAESDRHFGIRTIVFVDEIHRFNKAQQDAFLPYVEKGSIILIGATTENPSFEVNSALLSRCRVFVLHALTEENVMTLLHRALQDERGFGGQKIDMAEDLLRAIAVFSNGDARTALSTLEMVILNADLDENGQAHVTPETVAQCTSRRSLLYDKKGDGHYDLISALHKSMRNSDPDAAVYWLARMLEAGEDPLYIARRVVRFASEDIGLADSRALETAVAAYQACHFLGMPECTVHLTQAVVYMAMAPKSNALYVAYETAKKDAQEQIAEPVPLQIRNAQTSLMKNLGYGKGYVYAHDTQEKLSAMTCLPDSLQGRRYYRPTEAGSEQRAKQIEQNLQAIAFFAPEREDYEAYVDICANALEREKAAVRRVEIALVEVSNSADVETVKGIFQSRIDYQVGDGESPGGAWYPEPTEMWKNNSRIVSNGNYVMLVAFEDADAVVTSFNALFA